MPKHWADDTYRGLIILRQYFMHTHDENKSNPEIIQKWIGGIQGARHSKTVLNITLYHGPGVPASYVVGFLCSLSQCERCLFILSIVVDIAHHGLNFLFRRRNMTLLPVLSSRCIVFKIINHAASFKLNYKSWNTL